MIVLSLILVIAAAVLLVFGFFQSDVLWPVYTSIGACVLAMIFLGLGVLQRRRARTQRSPSGGYGPGAGSAPVRPSPAGPGEPAEGEDLGGEAEGDVIVRKRTAREAAETAVEESTRETPARKKVERDAVAAPGAAEAGEPEKTTGDAAREVLAGVKGLGPAKQAALLERFGSIEDVRDASVEELTEVKGFGTTLAESVQDQLAGGPAGAAEAGEPEKTTGDAAREVLAGVKGLGPAKQAALLERFGSIEDVRDASVEELTEVKGFGTTLAESVQDQLSES